MSNPANAGPVLDEAKSITLLCLMRGRHVMIKNRGHRLDIAVLFAAAAAFPTAGHGQSYNPVT